MMCSLFNPIESLWNASSKIEVVISNGGVTFCETPMVRFFTKEEGQEEPAIKLKVLTPPFYSKAMVFEMRLSRRIPAL